MPAVTSTTSDTHTSRAISPRSAPSSSLRTAPRLALATYEASTDTASSHITTRGSRVPGRGRSPVSQVARYQNRPSRAKTFAGCPPRPCPAGQVGRYEEGQRQIAGEQGGGVEVTPPGPA
ncbi:hypothetical protein SF23_20100, partial [Streptomyces sp. MBRL 10]